MSDLSGFIAALGDIPHDLDPAAVRLKSRDMSTVFSPVMKRELADKTAEAVVQPRSKAELVRIAAAAARHGVALLARGGGTCNFGQGIPLRGGAIVDTTQLNRVISVDPSSARVRAETGARLIAIDAATRPTGWELRMHPSTKRASTIGGFVGGGHAGIGSCVYGILRDRGNILGLEVVSVEESPRVIELRGADVNLVHHAYGANGLITEVEMPLAPAWDWMEAVVTFSDFMTAVRFGHELATSDGIVKKLISITGWPLPSMMRPLAPLVPDGRHMVLCMVAAPFMAAFAGLVADYDGAIAAQSAEGKGVYGLPIYEFCWGHARFHVNKTNRAINSVIGLFPHDDLLGSIERCYRRFAAIGPLHLEVKRYDGLLAFQGSPFFNHRDDGDLASVVEGLEAEGVRVANNHTFLVKEGGMKSIGPADISFKRHMDPLGLLNPGKMDFAAQSDAETSSAAALSASGWSYRDSRITPPQPGL